MEDKATIAIVEDHKVLRASLKYFLTTHKYRVIIEAIHGEDLLERFAGASEMPAICIISANLPVMDGPETVSKLKELYPMVKIIAYSYDELKGNKMVRLGADYFLPKHSEELLINCIEKIFKI